MNTRQAILAAFPAAALAVSPAVGKEKDPVTLAKCEQSYGTIAVVDGDTQGWSEYGLGSPRELIGSLAVQSGCFTLHNTASGEPADYLMNVIAGSKEQVDQGVNVAKAALTEGLVRSGAAGSVLSRVPGGAMLGMLGGLGGKKKTVAAGIRLLSPANGQTLAVGTGEVTKTSISFGGGGWQGAAVTAGYAGNKNGKLLVEAFVKAFNALAEQGSSLAALAPAAAPEGPRSVEVSVETAMRSAPTADAEPLRALRAGTTVTPTGKREGLMIEVEDNFGTRGWVSIEDLG